MNDDDFLTFGHPSNRPAPAVISEITVAQHGEVMDPQPLASPAERIPFIVRPVTDDQPKTDMHRELKVINGVSYYCYYPNDPESPKSDDSAFTSYVDALSGLPLSPPSQKRLSINRRKTPVMDWSCKCDVCTSPPRMEVFATVKDYKVVEGLRWVKCLGHMSFISKQVEEDTAYLKQMLPDGTIDMFAMASLAKRITVDPQLLRGRMQEPEWAAEQRRAMIEACGLPPELKAGRNPRYTVPVLRQVSAKTTHAYQSIIARVMHSITQHKDGLPRPRLYWSNGWELIHHQCLKAVVQPLRVLRAVPGAQHLVLSHLNSRPANPDQVL